MFPLLLAQEAAAEVTQVANDYWANQFFGLDRDQRFVLLLVIAGCVTLLGIVITAIAAGVYSSVQNQRLEAELKQDMLDRGMSVEEISEVIGSAPLEDAVNRWVKAKLYNVKKT